MKIIPIFFYHEKWAVVIRKFVYSSDGVEKMGPLRGDGKPHHPYCIPHSHICREDGSPSWGRKVKTFCYNFHILVEKMGPLRGDGKKSRTTSITKVFI